MVWEKPERYDREEQGRKFGEYLDLRRKQWGATLEQLCGGLCTVSMLLDIRKGRKHPGMLLRERLSGRVGISGDEYETYLGYNEYTEWKMRQEILLQLEEKNAEEMEKKLEVYAKKYNMAQEVWEEAAASRENAAGKDSKMKGDVNHRLRRQFYLWAKGMYCRQQGRPSGEVAALLGEAVRQTVPDIDKEPVTHFLLSAQELDLILEYVQYRPPCEAIVKYREVLRYLENPRMEENDKVKTYPKAVLYLCYSLLIGNSLEVGNSLETESFLKMGNSLEEESSLKTVDSLEKESFLKTKNSLEEGSFLKAGNSLETESFLKTENSSFPEQPIYGENPTQKRQRSSGNRKDTRTYAEVLKLCDSAIQLLQSTQRIYYLTELLELKRKVLERLESQHYKNGESLKAKALEKMLVPTRKLEKIFGELYTRFGVPKERWKGGYLYYGQDTCYVGDMIRIRRKMLKIRREELCSGICSLDTLRRLENGQKNTQPQIVWELCTRLGLSAECERTELVTADLRVRELEREIRYNAIKEKFQENLAQLEELKSRIHLENNINRQWVLDMEGLAKYRLGMIDEKEYRGWIERALECTLPMSVFGLSDTEECYLTNAEMSCIYHFSLLDKEKKEWKNADDGMKLIYRMLEKFEKWGAARNHVRNSELYMEYKAMLLFEYGQYKLSIQYAGKVIQLCLRMGRINMLGGALYNWMRGNWMIRKSEQKGQDYEWKKDLEYCLALSKFCKNTVMEDFFQDVLKRVVKKILI